MFASILIKISLLMVVLSVILLIRNNIVLSERMRLLHLVSDLAKKAITENEDWEHYYDNFTKTSYEHMLFFDPLRFKWALDEDGNII
jgi:hypothetical protein